MYVGKFLFSSLSMYDVGYNRLLLSAACEDSSPASLVAGLISRSPNKRTANAIAESIPSCDTFGQRFHYVKVELFRTVLFFPIWQEHFCRFFLFFVFILLLGTLSALKLALLPRTTRRRRTAFLLFCAMNQRNVQTPFSSASKSRCLSSSLFFPLLALLQCF